MEPWDRKRNKIGKLRWTELEAGASLIKFPSLCSLQSKKQKKKEKSKRVKMGCVVSMWWIEGFMGFQERKQRFKDVTWQKEKPLYCNLYLNFQVSPSFFFFAFFVGKVSDWTLFKERGRDGDRVWEWDERWYVYVLERERVLVVWFSLSFWWRWGWDVGMVLNSFLGVNLHNLIWQKYVGIWGKRGLFGLQGVA